MVAFIQRALAALCFMTLVSCSMSAPCRQWQMESLITPTPCFNTGRLLLAPDSECSHIELEIDRTSSGLRLYVNLLFLEAAPLPDDLNRTQITIQFEGEEPWLVYPFLLKGGQRLLFPDEVADRLIQALLEERTFEIKMGRRYLSVIPTHFAELYEKLLALPI